MFTIKPILNRFKVYGAQTEQDKIRDLQATIQDLNDRLKAIEAALNNLQSQIP